MEGGETKRERERERCREAMVEVTADGVSLYMFLPGLPLSAANTGTLAL